MSDLPDNKQKNAPEEAQEINQITKTDDALESFLSRDQGSSKDGATPPTDKKKLSRSAIALICAIIVVAVLIIVVVIVANRPVTPISDDELPALPAELATIVDEKGEHHIEVQTDAEGEIEQNGYGELLSYTPAQIEKIEVENTGGSFTVNATTPEGEATVYTITGFENYDLQTGMADAVANDAAVLSFTTIAAVNGDPKDFGLDKPRATVRVTYTDDTTALIRVGNEADGGAGVYATLGDSSDIFLVSSDAVDSFLYTVLDMISYDITPAAESVDDSSFSVIEITGTRYPDPITLVPNTDEAIKCYYRLTKPYEMFADNYEGNDISGSIRDLYAESVVCVNPNDSQLKSFGVDHPYAAVHAVYPDTEINLSCSAPSDDGLVNLYNPDKGVIYTIRHDALGWAATNLDQLLPKTVIELNKSAVTRITVLSGSKTYDFTVSTATSATENEDGDTEEITVTKATMNKKRIPEDSFNIFFQNLSGMTNLGMVDSSGTNIIYEARLSYSTGRADDAIVIFDTGDKSCPVSLNGILIGSVSKSYVKSMQQDVLDIEAGKIPNSM